VPLPEVASLSITSSMRGAERRRKFERCRSRCLRGRLAGCCDWRDAAISAKIRSVHIQPQRRGSRSQHKPGKRNAPIVRDLDFTAADIDLGCRAADLQGNAPIAPQDIGLSSISSGAVSPASTDDSSTRLYASRGSSPITGWHGDRARIRSVRRPVAPRPFRYRR
jgi:hypothetical protein